MTDLQQTHYDPATPVGVVGRDEYIVEQDEMGDSRPQGILTQYLALVLQWLYRNEGWMIPINFHHYHNALENSLKLIVPDVAVFKDVTMSQHDWNFLSSWDMRKGDKPCPPVMFEISSDSTFPGDIELDKKPRLYGLIGVREFFAYDPNYKRVWPKEYKTRLLGWRYGTNKKPVKIEPDERGWLWSEVLESWLVEDGQYLRLYDRNGQLRLTADQANQKSSDEAQKQLKAERQQRRAERIANEQKLEAERIANEQKLEAERQQREAAEKANAELQRIIDELRRAQDNKQ